MIIAVLQDEILRYSSADLLEVQLVQLNHCDGVYSLVYSNYWNALLRNLKLSQYINF